MAEAVVEENAIPRFFCHKCKVDIPSILPDLTCPTCHLGFVEEIEPQPEIVVQEYDVMDVHPPAGGTIQPLLELSSENLGMQLTNFMQTVMTMPGTAAPDGRTGEALASFRNAMRTRDGPDTRRPGRYGSVMPRHRNMPTGGRVLRGRQPAAIENFIQDFLVNLTGAFVRDGNGPVVLVGNSGDYAWGREGLDAIVTQLLSQVDGAGPPPLSQAKIKEIPTVGITQNQVDNTLQCSICWEIFLLSELVRKLECDHVYHENCIIPWLELHGTCPICRKALADDTDDDDDDDEPLQTSRGTMTEVVLNPRSAMRGASGNEPGSSHASSAPSSSSTSSSSGNTQETRSASPDFVLDLEFD